MTVYQTALSGNAPAIPAGVDEALRLAGIGWAVFPLHPATGTPYANADIAAALAIPEPPKGKGGLHLATMDEAAIRALWRDRPGAHIGIATGAPSGLYVLDVD
jgi:putative DNA primase/helicase